MASKAVWQDRVRRWRNSGVTGRAFCEREGLKQGSLRHWAWVIDREARGASAPKSKFVELTAAVSVPASPFEVKLRNGHRVRVPARFDGAALEKLLTLLVR